MALLSLSLLPGLLLFSALFCCIQGFVSHATSVRSSIALHAASHQYASSRRRRRLLLEGASSAAAILCLPPSALAQEFKRQLQDVGYTLTLPPEFQEPSNKPLKTHLDEINFKNAGGTFQVGITVDPVRILSLQQFGTPEQVAARVVTAEVNRDGVVEVTLLKDPIETSDGAYVLEYLSKGKRGDKHYVCKIYVSQEKLLVLTAQVKEADYVDKKQELMATVDSFRVL